MEWNGFIAASLVVSSAFAVAINTITGGGTLITLPVLIAFGVPLKEAVSINMVALAIGGIGSVLGGQESFKKNSFRRLMLMLPTAIGAVMGSVLLVKTRIELLEYIIPVLVLIGTLSLFIPRKLQHLQNRWVWLSLAIFLVSVYGGYFGAGMGVMLVSVLTLFSPDEFHALNSLKNLQQVLINTISATILLHGGLVLAKPTFFMVSGGLFGGYIAGKALEGVSAASLRTLMVSIGLLLSVVMCLELWLL